jgi:cell division septum initiation protein DivIVA
VQAATKGIKWAMPSLFPLSVANKLYLRLIAAQEENAYLRQRVATLEEALKQMQNHIEPPKKASTSSASSSKDELDNDTNGETPPDEDTSGALSAFGHLTLGEEGESYYHGQAAQTEVRVRSSLLRHRSQILSIY